MESAQMFTRVGKKGENTLTPGKALCPRKRQPHAMLCIRALNTRTKQVLRTYGTGPDSNPRKGLYPEGRQFPFYKTRMPGVTDSGAHGTELLPHVTGECNERFKPLTKFGVNILCVHP